MPISAAFNGQVAGLAVLGGLMLGASASLFLLLQGRITGALTPLS